MGYQVILDVLGAMILGGVFLLNLFRFQGDDIQNKQESRDDIVAQQNLVALVDLFEDDFRRIGYCANRDSMVAPVVGAAGPDYITFKTDLITSASPEGDGQVDSVGYWWGELVSETSNPRDRMLYRRENSGPWRGSSLGVTYLDFKYFRYNGDTLSRPVTGDHLKEICSIQVTLRVENLYPFTVAGSKDSLDAVSVNWKQFDFEIKNFGRGVQ
jgi:hypothetical protein